jgi:hypothetical protein
MSATCAISSAAPAPSTCSAISICSARPRPPSAISYRAAGVSVVVTVARGRTDRNEREAAGAALLAFRDRGRALAETTSAALRWLASRSAVDRARPLSAYVAAC